MCSASMCVRGVCLCMCGECVCMCVCVVCVCVCVMKQNQPTSVSPAGHVVKAQRPRGVSLQMPSAKRIV